MPKKEERWITAKEATDILNRNAQREDIPASYIRSLVRSGHVEAKELDGRTRLYKASDVEGYTVARRGKRTQGASEQATA